MNTTLEAKDVPRPPQPTPPAAPPTSESSSGKNLDNFILWNTDAQWLPNRKHVILIGYQILLLSNSWRHCWFSLGFTLPLNPVVPANNYLPWPTPSDLNTRLRRIVAGFQRILKKEELKRVAVEKVRVSVWCLISRFCIVILHHCRVPNEASNVHLTLKRRYPGRWIDLKKVEMQI